jgi:hypothetical protein
MTTTLPQKFAGGRGSSVLDRMPDSLIELAGIIENPNWMDELEEVEGDPDGVDAEFLVADGDPLSQDPEILDLTKQLDSYYQKSSESQEMTKEEQQECLERMQRLAARKKKKKKVKGAAYMPNLRTRVYKEWVETQHQVQNLLSFMSL